MVKINYKKITWFIGFTIIISWGFAGLTYTFEWWSNPLLVPVLGSMYMFIPLLAVFIVQKGLYKESVIKPLAVRWKINLWWMAAILLPPVFILASFLVSLLMPTVQYAPNMEGYMSMLDSSGQQELQLLLDLPFHPIWILLFQGILAGLTINVLVAFGEELGWRGFLQRELIPLGFWKASLIVGLVWGVWHAPLILQGHNYPEYPVTGVFMMLVFCIMMGPIFSFITIKSKSVIATSALHGSINAHAGLGILWVQGGNELIYGITGISGFIILLTTNLVILILYRHSLNRALREHFQNPICQEAQTSHSKTIV